MSLSNLKVSRNTKHLDINLTKEMRDLHHKNFNYKFVQNHERLQIVKNTANKKLGYISLFNLKLCQKSIFIKTAW